MKLHYDGPVVLVVMDGVGLSPRRSGNAVRQAHTEFLDHAMLNYLNIPLAASGEAVGIMPGQMGNSEVGHNAIGAGQIIPQGVAQIEAAFATGDIWLSRAWRGAMQYLRPASTSAKADAAAYWRRQAKKDPTLHFAGIFSDGGVHSDIKYLEQMVARAYDEGVRRIRFHCIFDGRDVAPQSEPRYIERLEKFCAQFSDADFRIASGGGRMVMTADRYENDWGMVKLGWDAMVFGVAPYQFASASEAIATFRRNDPSIQDQYLPAFVIVEPSQAAPIGRIQDGDVVIYYDFRADRAVEIAEAFTAVEFDKFDRTKPATSTKASVKTAPKTSSKTLNKAPTTVAANTSVAASSKIPAIAAAKINPTANGWRAGYSGGLATAAAKINPAANPGPAIYFAGLTEYNQDRHIPEHILVPPVSIKNPLNTFLGAHHITQLAISETAKFGHITYYFNGNSYKKARGEEHIEIPSYTEPFDTRPWMRAAEITDAVLERLPDFKFIRINYPGGDMVGHFAELEPTITAVEAIDIQLARLARAVDAAGGMMIITADHGNAEELLDSKGNPKTAHSTNPVPCIFYDNTKNAKLYRPAKLAEPGLANLAATIVSLLGLDYPAGWQKPLLVGK